VKKSVIWKRVVQATKFILPILIVIWIGSMGILTGSLLNRAKRLQQTATDPTHLNLNALAGEVHGARRELSILQGELAPVLWICSFFGGDIGSAQPLMEAGVESLKAADESLGALTPLLGDLELSTFSMEQVPQILDAVASAYPAFERANVHIDAAATSLKRIKGPLSPRLEGWVSKAHQLVEIAQEGLGGAEIIPGLLGQEGARTYLILLQNSDELRPTGGFISAVGRIQINRGQLSSVTAEDSYAIDDFSKNYPDPPKPLLYYMGSEQWVFRDANWSPDFPTTALDAIHIYQVSRPEQVDGVIGLNLKGVEMLISGLEPLEVQGLIEPVTSANIAEILQEAWNPSQGFDRSSADWWSWYLSRKQSINKIMQAAMDKLLMWEVNWKPLAQGMIEALKQRQLMIYTVPEATELKRLNWDGSLRSSMGDYLMIVDANVGFNKVNPLIREDINYQVTLLPDGTGHAIVEINYSHQGTMKDILCSQIISYHSNVAYTNMMQACYYDYLRLIVPRGSRLLKATNHPAPGKYLVSGVASDGEVETLYDDLDKWTMFGQFFVIEYGKQLLDRLEYDLPVVVSDVGQQKRYTLLLQKQSGNDAVQIRVKLTLPAHAMLISSSLTPDTRSGDALEFDLRLDVDQQLELIYAPAP
jgi:hypothetical protein